MYFRAPHGSSLILLELTAAPDSVDHLDANQHSENADLHPQTD